MSILSSMIGAGLAALSGAAAQTLQYRTSPAGSWTAFATGIVPLLVPADPIPVGVDNDHRVITAPQTATLRIPIGGVLLVPGPSGAQVKDQNGTVWGVISISYRVSHTHYTCQRASTIDASPAQGRV